MPRGVVSVPTGTSMVVNAPWKYRNPCPLLVIWQVVGAHDSRAVVHAVYPCLFAGGYADLRDGPALINQNALNCVPGTRKSGDFAGFIDCLDSAQSGEILDGAESL